MGKTKLDEKRTTFRQLKRGDIFEWHNYTFEKIEWMACAGLEYNAYNFTADCYEYIEPSTKVDFVLKEGYVNEE